ncbi:MAG: putative quinol monooxygenase [Paracoccaceae bacterium]
MSVVVQLTLKAKDETYDTLVSTMKAILPDTAKYEGAELISCSADPADKSVRIWELWDKIESQQAYFAWRTGRGEIDALVEMLREPPVVEEMEHVAF